MPDPVGLFSNAPVANKPPQANPNDPAGIFSSPTVEQRPKPKPKANPVRPGMPPVGRGYVAPPLGNFFDLLDYQRAAVSEGRFHQHSADANMAATREAVFGPGFNEHWYSKKLTNRPEFQEGSGSWLAPRAGVPMSGAPKAIAGLIDLVAHGAIDQPIEAAEDPLMYESLGVGPLAKFALGKIAKPLFEAAVRAGAQSRPVKAALAIPRVKANADEIAYHAKHIATLTKKAWQKLTTYAPQTREEHGNTLAREAIANEAVQGAEAVQLERRIRTLDPGVRTMPEPVLRPAVAAMQGKISLLELSPESLAAYKQMRALTNSLILLKAEKGRGAIAKISKWGSENPGVVKKVIHGSPKVTQAQVDETLSGAEKQRASMQAAQAQEAAQVERLRADGVDVSKFKYTAPSHIPDNPTTEQANDLLNFVENLRREAHGIYRASPEGPQGELLRDLGVPIEKPPNLIKKPFTHELVRAPSKRAFSLKGIVPPTAPELPDIIGRFKPEEGWVTGKGTRRQYFPNPREAERARNQDAQEVNRLVFKDPHEKPRDEEVPVTSANLDQFRDAWDNMISSAAKSVASARSVERLKGIFGGSIPKVVEQEIYTSRVPEIKDGRTVYSFGDYWKMLVNLPRWGVIGTSTRHVANIFDLLANADPTAVPDAVKITAHLQKNGYPVKMAQGFLRRAVGHGGQMPNKDEIATQVEDYLQEATSMGLTAPFRDKGGFLQWSPLNKLTWDFDTAAAWSLGKKLLERGEARSPLEAGQMARELLVDYRHTSNLTKAAAYAIPFSAFGTQFPSAVARGVGRSIPRAAVVGRAFPPFYGSHTDDQGNQRKMLYYGPTSETGAALPIPFLTGDVTGGMKNIGRFVRQRAGAPAAVGLNLALRAAPGVSTAQANAITYGQDPFSGPFALAAALAPVPFSRTVLGQSGLGPFAPLPWPDEILRTMTGLLPGDPVPAATHKAITNLVNGTFAPLVSAAKADPQNPRVQAAGGLSGIEADRAAMLAWQLAIARAKVDGKPLPPRPKLNMDALNARPAPIPISPRKTAPASGDPAGLFQP